ncbi:MAG: methyltransferase domain-containing protein, partial [Acidobacteriota bacterium]
QAPRRARPRGGPRLRLRRRLPFQDGAFDVTVSFDLFEHVHDGVDVAAELARVTAPRGVLVATTPNRFSLSAEPHVGLGGVGLLPRRRISRYVRWRRGLDSRHVSPLSLRVGRKREASS